MFRIFTAKKSTVLVEHENFIKINMISKGFFNLFNYKRAIQFSNSFVSKINQSDFFTSKEFGSCTYFQKNIWFYIVEDDEKIGDNCLQYFKNLRKCIELYKLNHVVLNMVDVRFLMRYNYFDEAFFNAITNNFDDLNLAFYLLD